MDKQTLKKAVEELKKNSQERKFKQSVDLIINLKDLDLKKQDNTFETFLTLPYNIGKKMKVCALVGAEMIEQAKKECDKAVNNNEFNTYQGNKKLIKKLADEYDFFIAQANIMPEVAKVFGMVLGPKKKMPNPKAGCVVPPNINLRTIIDKLQKTTRVSAKTELAIKVRIGNQDSTDEQLVDNALAVYNTAVQNLPNEQNNVKNVLLKYTMSKPVKIL